MGLLTWAVYLDLNKAFDTVDHNTVLKKLSSLGIRDNALSCIQDYLHDRSECVCRSNTGPD